MATDGGYLVTGKWAFASGSPNCDWLFGGCTLLKDGQPILLEDGTSKTVFAFMRMSEITIIPVWNTLGLRGTGSNNYTAKDVFVPATRVFDPAEAPVPYWSWVPTHMASMPLGMARRAIDELVATAQTKLARGGAKVPRETSEAAVQIAHAEGSPGQGVHHQHAVAIDRAVATPMSGRARPSRSAPS